MSIKSSRIPPGVQSRDGGEAVGRVHHPARTDLFAVVVDDDEAVGQLIAAALAELGVASATYVDGKRAVASLDQRRPDIIFLDLALDHADAIDVFKWLSEKHYDGIVQLMSGSRRRVIEAVQRLGMRHGLAFAAPLQKPVRPDAIRQAIGGLLQMRSARQRLPDSG